MLLRGDRSVNQLFNNVLIKRKSFVKKIKYFIIFFGWTFCLICKASEVSDALNARLAATKTFQANFVETVIDAHGKQLSQSTGKVFIVRPGQFRWQVLQPNPELIIADSKTINLYDPSLQQLIIRAVNPTETDSPVLLLSRTDISSDQHFAVSLQSKHPEIFRLVPKNKDSLFAEFLLEFNRDDLQKMTFFDHLGQKTTVQFLNEKRNQSLSATLFHFKAPKGTDVIHD